MADGYGSKAKPVALDPFQNIVDVHWNTTPKNIIAIAFSVRLQTFVRLDGEGNAFITLRYWNPSDYSIALPPLFWNAWVLDDTGWDGSPSAFHVTGLPPLGSPPDYDWSTPSAAPPVAGCRWSDPTGGAMGIKVPIIAGGETEARTFQSGNAGVDNYDSDGLTLGARIGYPIDAVTATFESFDFQYAGAVAVPKVIAGAGNILIGGPPDGPATATDFELWMLCTRITS